MAGKGNRPIRKRTFCPSTRPDPVSTGVEYGPRPDVLPGTCCQVADTIAAISLVPTRLTTTWNHRSGERGDTSAVSRFDSHSPAPYIGPVLKSPKFMTGQ